MGKYTLDLNKYAKISRQAAAEGCVLLKNKQHTLPIRKNDKIAIFGRSAFNYYKSGLGSGGLVNTRHTVGILEALKNENEIIIDKEILNVYEKWVKENPFDAGEGWGKVPWSQKEMPIDDDLLHKAKSNDLALIIIGRTAGEDQDAKVEEGSYLLTETEERMIEKVCSTFERCAVILNTASIIDMSWVEKYNPSSVLYVWHGGQEGGNGVLDVLTGKVNPSGKLTDTIAKSINDYPSTKYFGDIKQNFYTEDIYVGYRYFETFAKDKVIYPFGFGLSYTKFDINAEIIKKENGVLAEVKVKNIGEKAGKEVVQIYLEAPQGLLGKPSKSLIGFKKTKTIKPGDSQKLSINIPLYYMASFDDMGVTGDKYSYVLETGEYKIYAGSSVRDNKIAGKFSISKLIVLEILKEACAPKKEFKRFKPKLSKDSYMIEMEDVPIKTVDTNKRIEENRKENPEYKGDMGYKFSDVKDGKVSIDMFLSQLSNDDLIHMFRGEGMCSPKATPGTAGAFGGVTKELRDYSIPIACCADGPSGIRMDCGTKAFSLPSGMTLACTFNVELNKKLFEMLGLELRLNKIDTLLGPGMNIHRNPLNGRNFEYFSEDPLLTGKIASAQVMGMNKYKVTGTIKHFCANNQEAGRSTSDSIISQRALREIYLKGFEIAVKEGEVHSVMSTYGAINGIWTSGNYDLLTMILRKEWNFDGIVMTDWWAVANEEDKKPSKSNKASMIMAQNDLYMVVSDSKKNPEKDNVVKKLKEGYISRYELVRNGKNILKFILSKPTTLREFNLIEEEECKEYYKDLENDFDPQDISYYEFKEGKNRIKIDTKGLKSKRGKSETFALRINQFGKYEIKISAISKLEDLTQLPISVYFDNELVQTIVFKGSKGSLVTKKVQIESLFGYNHYIRLYFGADGLEIKGIRIEHN